MQGQAEEVAYSVTEAAGANWLTPEIWYKEEQEVNADLAREILTQAQNDKSYEDPIPEDDAKAIEEANALVEMAETAWKNQMRGPQVEALLRLAHGDIPQNGDTPPKSEEPTDESPAPEPPAPPTPPPPGPEPEDTPQDTGTDPDLANTEPWDGYKSDNVPDIINGIDYFVSEEEDPRGILGHVWAFETAHKNRVRIIAHLEKQAEGLGPKEDTPESETPSDPQPESETPPEEPTPEEPQPEESPEAPEEEETPAPVETEEPPAEEPPAEPAPEEPKPEPKLQHREEIPEGDDVDAELVKLVEDELRRQTLTFPEPPGEEIPKVPWDLTRVTGQELQRLHSFYSNLAYYKNFQLQREERLALHYKLQADEIARELLVTVAKYDEKGKEKKVTVLEAEIESTDGVKRHRRRARLHDAYATAARQERDGYTRIVEMLSRQHTMRNDEWQRSGEKKA